MKKVILTLLLVGACAPEPQDMKREIACQEISAGMCLCCNASESGRCLVSSPAAMFTEACKVMSDGGFPVKEKGK